MGPGISRASGVVFAKNETFQRYTNNVFDVGLDEIAFSKEFSSKLFHSNDSGQKKLKLPGENIIVDVISNPLLFTQAQTASEALITVISPIFSTPDSLKSTTHQILSEFFVFLSAKPDNILKADEEYNITLQNQKNKENDQLYKIFNNNTERTPINIEELKSLIPNIQAFIDKIQSYQLNIFRYNPIYLEINVLLVKNHANAVPLLLWGFTCGDLSAIIEGLSNTISLPTNKLDTKIKIKMNHIVNKVNHLAFNSTITIPYDSTIIGTVSIPQTKSQGTKPSSIISCDGRNVFLLGHHGVMHIVKLSDTFTNIDSRFHKIDLKIPKEERINLSIVVSNGYIIVTGPFLKHQRVIKIHSLQDMTNFKFAHHITSRCVSDGQLIYSCHKKKIHIYSEINQVVASVREIEPYVDGTTLQNPFAKELIPSNWEEKSIMYVSGNSFIFLVPTRNDDVKCEYFARTFSLIDGKHLGDLVLGLKVPIIALTNDPWNNCLWGVSPGTQSLFLVKLHKLGSKTQWLTGFNSQNIPKFSKIVSSFKKVKNIKTLLKASSTFLEYITANFVGTQLKTLLLSNFNISDVAYLIAPCSERILLVLVDAISSLSQNFATKYEKKKLFKFDQLQNLFISLIAILQINLSNICSRNMGNTIETTTIKKIVDLLNSVYNNKNLEFAKKITAYTFSTSFPVLFSRLEPEKCAAVFKSIYTDMESNFVYYFLRLLQNQRFFIQCFTANSVKEIIAPLIETLITSPHMMQQSEQELLVLFQRNLMIGVSKLYSENPKDIPPEKTYMQDTLLEYCKLIATRFSKCINDIMSIYKENSLRFSNFVHLFRKWILLLQPLSKFSRIAQPIVLLLQPIFVNLSELIKIANLNNIYTKDHSNFVFLYSLFFEVFTILIEFIMTLINGGSELNNADSYLWLVHATMEANITRKTFPDKLQKLLSDSNNDVKKDIIKTGIDDDKVKLLLTIFDQNMLKYEDILVSIFTRQNKATFKNRNDLIARNDILALFCLSKQFKLLDELSIYIGMKRSNQEIPLSLKFKGIIHSVNEIHRTQILIKQSFTDKPEEELHKKLDDIRNKMIFLLMIAPIGTEKFSGDLAALTRFISDDLTIELCLQMISDSQRVKTNISLGIDIISDIINRNSNIDFVSFLLDKVIKSESFMKYVSTIRAIDENKDRSPGFNNIFNLLKLLREILPHICSNNVINLVIIFYTNLLMMVGKSDPRIVFEPICDIFDILYSRKLELSEEDIMSYSAIISSCMYSVIKDSNITLTKKDTKRLLKRLFTKDSIDVKKLSLARLCLSSGMIVPFKEKMVLHFIKHIEPAVFHNAFAFLFEYIRATENRENLISWLLSEISSIASGGRPEIMRGYPSLMEMTDDVKHVKTPGVLMIACAAMIRVIRFCITTNSGAKDLVHDIITFILRYNINNGQNIEVKESMKMFTEKRYLFGVFAVLSNSILIPNQYSLIKDNSSNSVYYLTDIDVYNEEYHGWKTPITANSQIENIPYSPSIVPKSAIPFSPDMYKDYEHLMPFFTQALNDDPVSYASEALNFYILQSLKVYITDHNFLLSFMETRTKFQLKKFSLHNYSKDFTRILAAHLSSNSLGFLQQPSLRPHMSYCTMSGVPDTKSITVTENQIYTSKGAHCFLSDPLNPTNATYLHLDFQKKSHFNVGIHMYSLHFSSSESFMLSSNGSAIYNGIPIDRVPSIYGFSNVTLCYEPTAKKLRIYDNNTQIFTFKISEGVASFVIHTFGCVNISYSITNIGPKYLQSTNPSTVGNNVKTGKTVFIRNKRDKGDIQDLIKQTPFQQTNPSKIKMNKPKLQCLKEDPNSFLFSYDSETQPIISYPADLLKMCRTELDLEALDKIKQQIITYPTACFTNTSNAGTPSKIPVCKFVKGISKACISTFPLDFKPVFINDNTGEVTEIKDPQVKDVTIFQPIHIITYPYLPSEILNFFTTGYVYETRKDVQAHIFLQALSIVNFPKSRAIEIFDLEMPQLLEIALMLIINVEPIHAHFIKKKECPINFAIDATDKSYHITGPRYIHKQGVHMIFKHIAESELTTVFANLWKLFLVQQFTNFHMHFVRKSQPNAVVTQISALSRPRTIIKPSAVGFIIFRAGFDADGSIKVEDKDKNEYILTDGIVYVKGFMVQLTRIDAVGDGVIALPINPGTNETLFGTFFELILSLKYFAYFISNNASSIENADMHEFRAMIYTNFVDSFIAGSPFFTAFGTVVLEFLCTTVPLIPTDLVGDVVVHLSLLAIYTDRKKNQPINGFLLDQQTMWKERIYLPLKTYFPEFITPDEALELQSKGYDHNTDWDLPNIQFPLYLTNDEFISEFVSQVMRLMKPTSKKLTGFPFHLFLKQWALTTTKFLPYNVERISDKSIQVTVSVNSVPDNCVIKVYGNTWFQTHAKIVDPPASNNIIYGKQCKIFFNEPVSDLSQVRFAFVSETPLNLKQFVLGNREMFINDVRTIFSFFDENYDHLIFNMINISKFTEKDFKLEIPPLQIVSVDIPYPKHIIYLRASLLFSISWMVCHNKLSGPESYVKYLCHFMPRQLKINRFLELIYFQSNTDQISMEVNRYKASEVWFGTSKNLNNTLLMQFMSYYKNPRDFRTKKDPPFKVTFLKEEGRDYGGPCREFILETIKESIHPNVGIFIPVPNSVNESAENYETLIPVPDPFVPEPDKMYFMLGVLLGISIRFGLTRPIPVPPFFWKFLAEGVLTIEDIYSIDTPYKDLMKSLEKEIEEITDESTFASRFSLNFVVKNSRGQEIALSELGRTRCVTLQNIREYISLSKDFRIKELKTYLEYIREGMWENLALSPPPFITGEIISCCSCGPQKLTPEAILAVTKFYPTLPHRLRDIYIDVVKQMDDDKLSKLLKFVTARENLPIVSTNEPLISVSQMIDATMEDMLPTARTCYGQINIPNYSSVTAAKKMIFTAIEYAGTFENR